MLKNCGNATLWFDADARSTKKIDISVQIHSSLLTSDLWGFAWLVHYVPVWIEEQHALCEVILQICVRVSYQI